MKLRDSRSTAFRKYLPDEEATRAAAEIEATLASRLPGWARWYVPFLPQDRDKAILDLGCGSGDFLLWLQRQGYEKAEGIDISPQQTGIAQLLGVRNIHTGDLRLYLKKNRSRYATIFLKDILEHFSHDEILEVLTLVNKSLEPGGVCVIQVPNGVSPFVGNILYGDFTHRTAFSERSLRQILRWSGLVPVRFFGIEPFVHGPLSFLRLFCWKVIAALYSFCLTAESGPGAHIVTQNIVVVAQKADD